MSLFDDNHDCGTRRWSALEDCAHPMADPTAEQNFDQVSITTQSNDELIVVKDSCDIEVHTTSTEAAVNIQLALQVAIVVILEISVGDSIDKEEVLQDLLQLTRVRQSNKQRTIIENSEVCVTTTDTEVEVTAQIAIQILVALLIIIDVL